MPRKQRRKGYLSCLQGSKRPEKLHWEWYVCDGPWRIHRKRRKDTPNRNKSTEAGQQMASLQEKWLVLLWDFREGGQERQRLVRIRGGWEISHEGNKDILNTDADKGHNHTCILGRTQCIGGPRLEVGNALRRQEMLRIWPRVIAEGRKRGDEITRRFTRITQTHSNAFHHFT